MKEKSILLTVALLAGMMLTGCSKEESEEMEEDFKLNKNEIVGVWMNGMGEFVSFARDGYMCLKYYDGIFQGEYETDGNYINVRCYFPEGATAKFEITSLDDGAIYIFGDSYINGWPHKQLLLHGNYPKYSDIPCVKANKIIGGKFRQEEDASTIAEYTIEDYYRIKKSVSNKNGGEHLYDIYTNYVYLAPYMYVKGYTSYDENGIERNEIMTKSVYEVSFNANGVPTFKKVQTGSNSF